MKLNCLLFAMIVGILPSIAQDFIQSPYQNKFLSQFAVADFDGDGDVDVYGIDIPFNGPSDIYLYRNIGVNAIDFEVIKLEEDGDGLGQPVAADMDGDGDIDVIINRGEELAIVLQINQGDGTFEEMSLGISGAEDLKIIDLELDGDWDLVGMNKDSETLSLFINDGQLNYASVPVFTSENDLESFDAADMNGDGLVDLVVGIDDFFDEQVIYLQNKGDTNFEATTLIANDFDDTRAVFFADLNNNGLQDIVALNEDQIEAWVQGTDGLLEQVTLSEYKGSSFIGYGYMTFADFNGDGIVDILTGDGSGGTIWLKNISTNPLEYEQRSVGEVQGASEFAIHDLDLDGDVDIFLSNGDNWWYENKIEQQTTSISTTQFYEWKIFPNPFQDYIRIEGVELDGLTVELYNSLGQRVSENPITNSKLDLSYLEKGSYVLKVKNTEAQVLFRQVLMKVK